MIVNNQNKRVQVGGMSGGLDVMGTELLSTTYDPKKVERDCYELWMRGQFFKPRKEGRDSFSIVMPPPNVTGSLHLGHALNNTLQDILTRWRRMQGKNVLWLPGTDHAGIATQARVEEELAKQGITRQDLGREEFLRRVWAWKEEYGGIITSQLRLLGASCDWSRERFTMDEVCSRAVREVFVRLFRKGLIYRGDYIINWCPKCRTTISDIEVEHEEVEGKLYFIRYPFADGEGYVVVATTRPETMLGDTAVAVHPEDQRYQEFIGRTVVLPLIGRRIPVIADRYVDPDFGSGVVKITPYHDPNDFEVAQRHVLPGINVIGKDARMTEEAGPYGGLDRYACRQRVIQDLEAQGYLEKVEDYRHAVGFCYRCNSAIEPLVSRQWFVKIRPLAEPALEAVKAGRLRFVPERFTKIYVDWVENARDWCISRQLWWGHRIPVWYCHECGYMQAYLDDPHSCEKCGSRNIEQDPDVLDTWFSSALWPFSTLGWPADTKDLRTFYPTSVLVTGRDIIFFWVARMIFMGLEFLGEVPFREVLIHGLVLDALGRKMSKSLGNGVDPIEVIDEFGADTLRFMLVTGNTPGNDLRFHPERLESIRNFANKLWNASRFVLMNLSDYEPGGDLELRELSDRWIVSRYHALARQVTELLEDYELGEAARRLYDFIWGEFCDWYIELAKPRLYGRVGTGDRVAAQRVLDYVLSGILKLLHPFMPFITEEIWQHLPGRQECLIVSPWPEVEGAFRDERAEREMDFIMEVIRAIRNIRAEMRISPKWKVSVVALVPDSSLRTVLEEARVLVQALAGVGELEIKPHLGTKPERAGIAVVKGAEIYVPLEDVLDVDQEVKRLKKEIDLALKDLATVEKKLSNVQFLSKAPPEIVEKERLKQLAYREKIRVLETRLAELQI